MKIGKFETIGYLGGGNFGKVFRVRDTYLNVERAIKIVQAQNPMDFVNAINEAQILERCRHKHIVDIREIDVHEIGGIAYPCIVMEYLQNGSVQGALEKKFISVRESAEIIVGALLGLEHAHGQRIHHRDIKPGNILFSENGYSKLSDFGLSYGLAHQTFSFAGYSTHLSPEVLEQKAQDAISDLYSMGVTFFRIINNLKSLNLPFADDLQWLIALQKEKFPDRSFLPHIPNHFIKILKRSMKADRTKRFQTCLEFRQAIQKIPLAIDWHPINDDKWQGRYNNETFEIELYKKRTGFFIDFKRNGRKQNDKCFEQINTIESAYDLFYTKIRETTIKV